MKEERTAFKVAHFAVFGPHQCGLYHTAKDLVLAERELGIDARFIAEDGKVHKDGSLTTEKEEWAYEADILVRHSSIPTRLQCSGKPIVMCLHGRPESSLKLEQRGNPVVTAIANKANDCRYKAFITFWPEYVDIWKSLVGDKLHYVPACVDLGEFKPLPHKWDTPQVLICDMWREDVTPFNVIFAAGAFARRHGGKVHIVGLTKDLAKPMTHLLRDMDKHGVLGDISTVTKDIKSWYAKCNMLASPHVIATRAIREAMASGLKIVAGQGSFWTPFTANPMDVESYVEAMDACWANHDVIDASAFDPRHSASGMLKVFESVLPKLCTQRKVFVDIGAHLGETVRRFYREVPDAHEYEIYCFEPITFEQLDRNIGHIPNVTIVPKAMSADDGILEVFGSLVNDNEGATVMDGKVTGGVDYTKPRKVESVEFHRWYEANSGDYNIVKMNVEGAEYILMKHMLEHEIVPDKVFIQLHAHKFKQGLGRQRLHEIEARFWNEYPGKKFLSDKGMYHFNSV